MEQAGDKPPVRAAEAAPSLALIIAIYWHYKTTNLDEMNSMECLERLKQEVQRGILGFVRTEILEEEHHAKQFKDAIKKIIQSAIQTLKG